jgi:hypothetical protein
MDKARRTEQNSIAQAVRFVQMRLTVGLEGSCGADVFDDSARKQRPTGIKLPSGQPRTPPFNADEMPLLSGLRCVPFRFSPAT